MKNIFILAVLISISILTRSQNFSIIRAQIKDPNTDSWSELMTYSKLNIFIDDNKNIQFYDDNMRLMEILSAKKYVTQYDNIFFINKGLESKDEVNGIYGYKGTIKLEGKNNFSISEEAYASFMYRPGSSNVGLIEIRNKICMCYVRFWLN